MSGYTYEHAMLWIIRSKLKQEDFVSDYFKIEKYIQFYSGMINPILDKDLWSKVQTDEIMHSLVKRPHLRGQSLLEEERLMKYHFKKEIQVVVHLLCKVWI